MCVPVQAQDAGVYAPPDEELWRNMSQAFANISMPAQAHQQVQAIMQQVEREAKQRAVKKAAEPKK
jgi:hypothetical protein